MELVVASEEQKRERDRLTHAAWGQRLDLERFLMREEQLRSHPWARDAMTTWLLVQGGATLASCETFRMRSVHRTPRGAKEGFTYGIASVYTEPALRGKGHARELVERLAQRLRATDPAAQASILFSEVGPTIYRRVGFVDVPWFERIVPAQRGSVPPEVRLIGEREIAGQFESIPLPTDPFLVWPEAAQLDWHLERERAYAKLLDRTRPASSGAVFGESTLLWSADFKNERLCVLVGRASEPDVGAALLRAAACVSADAGLRSVHVWESASLRFPPDLGRIERSEDLPMLRPLVAEISPDEWLTVPRALWI